MLMQLFLMVTSDHKNILMIVTLKLKYTYAINNRVWYLKTLNAKTITPIKTKTHR